MKKQIKLITTVAAATTVFALSANAATTLVDEDFQNPVAGDGTGGTHGGNNTTINGYLPGWTSNNDNRVKFRDESTGDSPHDADNAMNQTAYMEYTNKNFNHNIAHNWAAGEVYTLTFNAAPTAWNIQNERWVRPSIKQQSGDDLLWAPALGATVPGQDATTEIFWHNQAVDGPNPYAWNGSQPFGTTDWQDQASNQYSFTFNADDFLGGAEGQAIYLELDSLGQRGVYFDNVLLTVGVVPEPTTTALLGLGGLALILRRRK